jgi:hypothetical protein
MLFKSSFILPEDGFGEMVSLPLVTEATVITWEWLNLPLEINCSR